MSTHLIDKQKSLVIARYILQAYNSLFFLEEEIKRQSNNDPGVLPMFYMREKLLEELPSGYRIMLVDDEFVLQVAEYVTLKL